MKITDGGLDDPRVQLLLARHFKTARAETAPASAHALKGVPREKYSSFSINPTIRAMPWRTP